MRCLQCGKKLSLLRKIANGEFCSVEHRDLYQRNECQLALARLRESQVRIERPPPIPATAAMAAIGRLRAMDSSDSDPVFVETFPIVESFRPRNQRLMTAPAIQPLVAGSDCALPDRSDHGESLSFASSGPLHGVVEPGPVTRPVVPRTLALRSLFRLGVRLMASGAVHGTGQMQHGGLSGITPPRPIARRSRVQDVPLEIASWVRPNQAPPYLPAFACRLERKSAEQAIQSEPPFAVDRILPSPVAISPLPVAMNAAVHPLPLMRQPPWDTPLRTATRTAKLRVLGLFTDHTWQPGSEPAQLQSTQPVALRTAPRAAAFPRSSAEAMENACVPFIPALHASHATPPHLHACENQERLDLRAAAPLTISSVAVEPAVAESSEWLPALKHSPIPRMRSEEAMQPVGLRCAAGVACIRDIAVMAAADSSESLPELMHRPIPRMRSEEAMQPVDLRYAAGVACVRDIAVMAATESMEATLPEPGAMRVDFAGMRGDVRLLAIGLPAAEASRIVPHSLETKPARSLDPALPSHEAVHTTLPRMRGEAGLQPVALRSAPAPATACAERPPMAMCAAAAAGGPAMPGFAAHPEPMAGHSPALAPAPAPASTDSGRAVSSPAADPVQPPGEAAPPAIDRQLPLAMGRAQSGGVEGHRTPLHGQSPVWDVSIDSAPAVPTARLTIDHADGSGSRQGRVRAMHRRHNLLPTIDLRRLPGRKFWTYAPADLKWVALGLPLILVFVVYSFRGSPPKAEAVPVVAAPQAAPAVSTSASSSFANSLKQVLLNRAAVNLLDDFRGGLGAWEGGEGWAKSWRYGQATFLEPGNLAFYKPSMKLRDYSLEFLGQIQGRSLNWVFRAKDARNYYVMRIVVTGQGPMPAAQIVQYAVINGKEERPKVMPTPYPVRTDTMYLVRVEVRGDTFSTFLQGQPLYSFTDDRLQEGGIGFFGPKGDKSYLRWVQVKHQYDYLGRLCALLAPYHVPPEAAKSE